MTTFGPLGRQNQARARGVFVLVLVMTLNLALQACAPVSADTWLPGDRPVRVAATDSPGSHSGHESEDVSAECSACLHDGCSEASLCDGPVLTGAKPETRGQFSPDFGAAAVGAIDTESVCIPDVTAIVQCERHAPESGVSLVVLYGMYLI